MFKHPVHIGELTEQVELFHRTLTSDGAGGATMDLGEAYATEFAHVRPLSGSEREAAMRTEARSTFLVVIRHRDDVKETDVVRWDSRDMNVRFIRNRGPRPLFLELEVEMGVRI